MGISTIIVVSVFAIAMALIALFAWIGARPKRTPEAAFQSEPPLPELRTENDTLLKQGERVTIVDPLAMDSPSSEFADPVVKSYTSHHEAKIISRTQHSIHERYQSEGVSAPRTVTPAVPTHSAHAKRPTEADVSQEAPTPSSATMHNTTTPAAQATTESKKHIRVSSDLIITFTLLAESDHPFAGYELLQAILSTGFRHGDMQIFHRHQQSNGHGKVLFSLAAVEKPGTFDMNNMGSFSTPGLVFILQPNQINLRLDAFTKMVQSAMQLQTDLGGKLLDDRRQVVSNERIQELNLVLRQADRDRTVH